MQATWVVIAALLGFVGVALGAFGAHGLAAHFKQHPGLENTFKTGVLYHLYQMLLANRRRMDCEGK
jgi:uncharacterized membrane protein YgdD (TMEM256/DUF423 family)